ncbi:MAG: hypothetical protein P8N31_07075 [Planctomycetota bacterium]|nr:hypothetical protein [Planctomycetota bacterium]MDG2143298.1 hypothetical protein [Planctomycetota bacterium]
MAKWSIEKRVALCGNCEAEFADGDAIYSLLMATEDGLHRDDVCVQCRSDEACTQALFWWRAKFHEKKARGLQLDLEAIEALFIALGKADKLRLKELRYLMCLILLRKRRVKVTKVARSHEGVEGEFFLVKRPRKDEQIAVEVFDFDGDKIESLRDDLKSIFEGADPNELEATPAQPLDGVQADPDAGAASDEAFAEADDPSGSSEVAQAEQSSGTGDPLGGGPDAVAKA